ncbi:hypothetical protein BCR39DRAFT_561360 [Naematelia encephala]|uniref:Zn(2)-C6 fungal-type domain-containing protein n=1 Tax=Naematelia encephala TaxID=71784 RepID=A0A1Y2AQP6_9TREE|nr:hypothetical protein BCR39DRAFT_561360 [Naematelia encephala]
MSDTPDFTEIARQARRIVIANQAQLRIIQANPLSNTDQHRKRPKFSRSTAGCLVCRRQKVKCDETTPSCLRCISTQRQCQWPSPSDKTTKRKRNASTRSSETRTGPIHGDLPSSDIRSTAGGQENIGHSAINTAESLQDTTNSLPFSSIELSFTSELDFLDSHTAFNPEIECPDLLPSMPSCSNFDAAFSPQTAIRTPFTNLSRSSLLSRRAQKMRHPTMSPHHRDLSGTPISLRISMVESFVSAFSLDDTLFEFGPSHRNALATTNTNLDLLSNAYPSPVARTLFHHYRSNASRILITMGNIGPNPLLALCTPLMLLNTDSPASAAIRMSMLSTSVAHFTHETEEVVELKRLGPQWPKQKEVLQEMGRKFKQAALANMMLAVHGDGGPLYTDSILATADSSWGANLEFAMNYVNRKGGPQAMLKSPDSTFTRRYLIENLATHDVFSCFITGKEPALLGNYDQWWFESVETSQTRWEWESVERTRVVIPG